MMEYNNTMLLVIIGVMYAIAACGLFFGDLCRIVKHNANRVKMIVVSALAATTVAGCSSNPSVADRITDYNEQRAEMVEDSLDDAPDWFLKPPQSTLDVVYVTGTGRSKNMVSARNKAILDAQVQLADQVQALVSSNTRQQMIEANGNAVDNTNQIVEKIVKEANLAGYVVEDTVAKAEGRYYRFYSLVAYPIGDSNLMLQQQISNKMLLDGVTNNSFDNLNR